MPVDESMVATLSLGDALELRKLLDRRLAHLALKTLDSATLDTIDDGQSLANAKSLAEKASML